jgi:hypothetical protein
MKENMMYITPRQDTVRPKLNSTKEDINGKVQMKEDIIYKHPKKQ